LIFKKLKGITDSGNPSGDSGFITEYYHLIALPILLKVLLHIQKLRISDPGKCIFI